MYSTFVSRSTVPIVHSRACAASGERSVPRTYVLGIGASGSVNEGKFSPRDMVRIIRLVGKLEYTVLISNGSLAARLASSSSSVSEVYGVSSSVFLSKAVAG